MQNQATIRSSGFTLVETMIVVSILSIIAGVAVPNLVASRSIANESAVVATLRSVATAQFKFKTMGLVDVDRNGQFEFGTFGELCGATNLRGTADKLNPHVLSVKFSQTDASGRITDHGYHIAVHLPDAAGNGLAETSGNLAAVDPLLAQDYWTVVAWPLVRGRSGKAAYFVNQSGTILKCEGGTYSGTSSIPAPGCALVGTPSANFIAAQDLAVNTNGADGQRWVAVN